MPQFENHGMKSGIWSGLLTVKEAPARVALIQHGEIVSIARLEAATGTGSWQVEVALPSTVLTDGVHSLVLIADAGQKNEPPLPDAVQLDHLHLMAGAPLEHELTAEIQLIRAELDLLKREFRRLASFE